MRESARITLLGASMVAVIAAVLALAFPVAASAASVEASPVVTVEGSVSSIDGTVSVRPVVLTTETIQAIGQVVASSTPDGSASDVAWSEYRVLVWSAASISVFWLGFIPGYFVGR